jgi:thiol-disulfide isomerase/thioredoxin
MHLLGLIALCLLALGVRPTHADEALRFVDLSGEEVMLRAAPGETLFVHFWATWCHSCVEELPALQKVALECADGPARVVTVNAGDSAEEVERFIEEHGVELTALLDPKGRVWRDLSGEGLPVNLVLGPEVEPRVELGPRSELIWCGELARTGCSLAAPPTSD